MPETTPLPSSNLPPATPGYGNEFNGEQGVTRNLAVTAAIESGVGAVTTPNTTPMPKEEAVLDELIRSSNEPEKTKAYVDKVWDQYAAAVAGEPNKTEAPGKLRTELEKSWSALAPDEQARRGYEFRLKLAVVAVLGQHMRVTSKANQPL